MERNIQKAIHSRGCLVFDGGWGTFLQSKGWKPGICPELWNVERPEVILELVKAYVEAGAEIVETNSFGGSVFKLAHYGLENRIAELNRRAAELSRQAAGGERWVAGSMGPTGKLLVMGDVTEEELYRSFQRQAEALLSGGADLICVESMSDIEETSIAVRAAKSAGATDIAASFTYEPMVQGDFKTMMGTSPAQAAEALASAGATIIGANCGNGYEGMEKVLKELKSTVPELPLLFYPNAGIPQRIDGVDVFGATPEDMATQVPLWIKSGASIIGGCCGTTPDHIRAIARAISAYTSK